MAKIDPHSDAALEVSDQAEYNKSMAEALKLDVTVRPIEPKGNLIGYATLKFNDSFVVEDFKVLQSEKGIFVGMPSKPYTKDGKTEYRDTSKPITKEFRTMLTEAVTAEYHAAVERLQARVTTEPQKKTGMKEQMANGAKQAEEHNAKKPPAQVGKDKAAEI